MLNDLDYLKRLCADPLIEPHEAAEGVTFLGTSDVPPSLPRQDELDEFLAHPVLSRQLHLGDAARREPGADFADL